MRHLLIGQRRRESDEPRTLNKGGRPQFSYRPPWETLERSHFFRGAVPSLSRNNLIFHPKSHAQPKSFANFSDASAFDLRGLLINETIIFPLN